MNRSFLPFLFIPSHAAARVIGRERDKVAVLALQAILRNHRSLEVAHQQIRWRTHNLAFSSRITGGGELVVELDIGSGDPTFVFEQDGEMLTGTYEGTFGDICCATYVCDAFSHTFGERYLRDKPAGLPDLQVEWVEQWIDTQQLKVA